MSENHEDQKSQEEPELIYTESGEPFRSFASAQSTISRKLLSPDDYTVIPTPDSGVGFVIKKVEKSKTPEIQKYVETYHWVSFHAKTSKNDTDDVILSVNGECLVIQREKRVPIPQRFLECADHARYPQFTQMPGVPRKIVGSIMTYPYTRYEEATEQDYIDFKTKGTEATRKAQHERGYDLLPEHERMRL